MKELTIEQKAKAYDEALKYAMIYYKNGNEDMKMMMKTCFPFLIEESEDEKIRKEIIEYIRDQQSSFISAPDCRDKYEEEENNKYNSWIAWLEKQNETKEINEASYRTGIKRVLDNPESYGLKKQGEQKPVMNVPSREVILSIWDLGNEWKELTNGSISTEYGTQLNYIQKHWHESEYYLREKQSEQKPADKVESKFKVGDWVIDKQGITHQIANVIENVTNHTYGYDIVGGGYFNDDSDVHLWTIKDAKPGDVLTGNKGDVILMFRGIGNTRWDDVIDYYCYYDYNRGDLVIQTDIEYWGNIINNQLEPATKEHRDTLFAKIKEAGYEWDDEKKELKKIEDEEYNGEDYGIDSLYHAQRILEKTLGSVDGYQTDDGILSHKCAITAVKKLYEQKPVDWSEEDDNFFNDTIAFFKDTKNALDHVDWLKSIKDRVLPQSKQKWSEEDNKWIESLIQTFEDGYLEGFNQLESYGIVDWLKSIKERYTWKPSDEQMNDFKQVYDWYNTHFAQSLSLNSLYNDLKKLKEK